jgi:hypothetical protein
MVPIAHAYTDQQLWELSLYIASLPEHEAEGEGAGAVEPDAEATEHKKTGGGE